MANPTPTPDLSLLESIHKFSATVTKFIEGNILDTTASFANYAFAIFASGIVFWLVWNALKFAAISGEEGSGNQLKEEIRRFLGLFIFVSVGFYVLPAVDSLGKNFSSYYGKFAGEVKEQSKGTVQEFNPTEHLGSEFTEYEKRLNKESNVGWYITKKHMANAAIGVLTFQSSNEIQKQTMLEIVVESMINEKAKDLAALSKDPNTDPKQVLEKFEEFRVLHRKYKLEVQSILDWSMEDILVYILEILGALIATVMRTFQLLLLALFKLAFPVTIALSLIPTMEETWKKWTQGYISVVMLGVTISLIQALCAIIASQVGFAPTISILLLFITSIFLLISPAINAMLFGGDGAMAGLPQQIMMGGGMIFGIVNKAASKLKLFKESKPPLGGGDQGGGGSQGGGGASSPDGPPAM